MSVKETWGMACPSCKRDDKLMVVVKMWADILPDSTDAYGDQEWDGDSECQCENCGWHGVVHEAEHGLRQNVAEKND